MLDVVVKGNYVLWVFPLVSPISPSVWTLWRDKGTNIVTKILDLRSRVHCIHFPIVHLQGV